MRVSDGCLSPPRAPSTPLVLQAWGLPVALPRVRGARVDAGGAGEEEVKAQSWCRRNCCPIVCGARAALALSPRKGAPQPRFALTYFRWCLCADGSDLPPRLAGSQGDTESGQGCRWICKLFRGPLPSPAMAKLPAPAAIGRVRSWMNAHGGPQIPFLGLPHPEGPSVALRGWGLCCLGCWRTGGVTRGCSLDR